MIDILSLVDYIFVGAFGCILSVAFAGEIKCNKVKAILFITSITLLMQGILVCFLDYEVVRKYYPLVTHLPLLVFLWSLQRSFLWSATSVVTAYLCCQVRRFSALLLTALVGGDDLIFTIIQITITIPLLWCIIKFIVPAMQEFSLHSKHEIFQFMIIGLIYYLFDYITTVYTDILYSGNKIVVEFMPFVCCIGYFIFLSYSAMKEKERFRLELERNELDIQAKQSLHELAALRKSQEQAIAYRHDLRHHLQYLACCMENDQIEQAQTYIIGICEDIEAQKVIQYCENETVNLILSAYVARCEKAKVSLRIKIILSEYPLVSSNDLCIILSNALENSLHECQKLRSLDIEPQIDVRGYEKSGRIILQISNTCGNDIPFHNGLPVTNQKGHGHGIGVRSIQGVVQRYNGLSSFSVKDNLFILRVSI